MPCLNVIMILIIQYGRRIGKKVYFLVSASNELGKVWEETEEENLVPVVNIVKRDRRKFRKRISKI